LLLADLAAADMPEADASGADGRIRGEARALLFGFAEFHLERRMKSLPMLARSLAP
jgi:hypothetical protein